MTWETVAVGGGTIRSIASLPQPVSTKEGIEAQRSWASSDLQKVTQLEEEPGLHSRPP